MPLKDQATRALLAVTLYLRDSVSDCPSGSLGIINLSQHWINGRHVGRNRTVRIRKQGDLIAIALIGLSLLLITSLHYSAAPGLSELHTVYRYFYFLPIAYAALRFGFRGGLATASVTTLLFAPHIIFKWGDFPQDSINDLLVSVVFFGVALITGLPVDRMREAQAEQTKTAGELADSLHQLKEQGEELRRAERLSALGSLAGGLAHEIRNPVGIIRAATQLLATAAGDPVEETVAVIQQETDRIEQLVQDLLNFAGAELPVRSPYNVEEIIDRTVQRVRPMTTAAGIALEVSFEDGLPVLDVDPAQIEQALLNLCVNANQACDYGGQIWITACHSDTPNLIELSVADDGHGIDAQQHARIFDPFYSTKEGGAGLGLSVVQRIVDDHGGRIHVESKVGGGATFIIYLPYADQGV